MWLRQETTLYKNYADNIGRPATFQEIFFWGFEPSLKSICELRKLNKSASNYLEKKRQLKSKLQCYTPAALLESKAKDHVKLISRTGVMQFDFDFPDISEYGIEDLKQAVFSLPFIGYCGLSCGGEGFYALALIAEPERLFEYATHCFKAFESLGIKADKSKGKKVENLRYVSYDANMLVRTNPEPLRIKKFYTADTNAWPLRNGVFRSDKLTNEFLKRQLDKLINTQPGRRMITIQQVAFTLGGKQKEEYLEAMKNIIYENQLFDDDTKSFIKCADDCFRRGMQQPF